MSDNSGFTGDYDTDQASFWTSTEKHMQYPRLKNEVQADVVVVGGGIAGITVGFVLQRAGHSVVVLEKNTIASGTTGGTTGKVTVQQDIFYADLVRQIGHKRASEYAKAYMQAFSDMEKLVETELIDCDWTTDDNYVYTTEDKRVPTFIEEAEASASLGLPAELVTESELPFKIEAAVKFRNQAKFDAFKYTHELARKVDEDGKGSIYENSMARKVNEDGDLCLC
jgi:glycine/D-amino acid oxidase-like deaminating enzyme